MVVIPFRDRGLDPLRQANLERVLDWWADSPWGVLVVDDGRTGDAQFNRSAAYNRGAAAALAGGADVVIYTEADILVPHAQVALAVQSAAEAPGLVVPFLHYNYLSAADSQLVRDDLLNRTYADPSGLESLTPESSISNGRSMGAVNVVSLASIAAIGGWDESFEGNSYDDNAMDRAFTVCCGVRRHVAGSAWHLYHLPAHEWWGTNDALTEQDRAATAANKQRWDRYAAAITPAEIRALTGEHRAEEGDRTEDRRAAGVRGH